MAIQDACTTIELGYQPPITFMVLQKRHHARFFPKESKDAVSVISGIVESNVFVTGIVFPPVIKHQYVTCTLYNN